MRFFLILVLSFVVSGCTSFGKGIAEAFLEQKDKKDTRLCEIISKGFDGIASGLTDGKGMTKLLQIHGVGHHVPGYSTEFLEKLAKELDMSVRSINYKEIQLTSPRFPDKKLGVLRVKRLLNEEEAEELLFYELTWSEITAEEKAELEYDTSGEYSYRRAEVNGFLKKFSNDTSPDPMLYMGYHHDEILASFTTAFCWMISADWDGLPDDSDQYCNPLTEQALQNLEADHYSFVSHSLGSRITIDGMQDIASKFSDKKERGNLLGEESRFINTFRNKQFSIYMLPIILFVQKLV